LEISRHLLIDCAQRGTDAGFFFQTRSEGKATPNAMTRFLSIRTDSSASAMTVASVFAGVSPQRRSL
jgi:hypothetical protein